MSDGDLKWLHDYLAVANFEGYFGEWNIAEVRRLGYQCRRASLESQNSGFAAFGGSVVSMRASYDCRLEMYRSTGDRVHVEMDCSCSKSNCAHPYLLIEAIKTDLCAFPGVPHSIRRLAAELHLETSRSPSNDPEVVLGGMLVRQQSAATSREPIPHYWLYGVLLPFVNGKPRLAGARQFGFQLDSTSLSYATSPFELSGLERNRFHILAFREDKPGRGYGAGTQGSLPCDFSLKEQTDLVETLLAEGRLTIRGSNHFLEPSPSDRIRLEWTEAPSGDFVPRAVLEGQPTIPHIFRLGANLWYLLGNHMGRVDGDPLLFNRLLSIGTIPARALSASRAYLARQGLAKLVPLPPDPIPVVDVDVDLLPMLTLKFASILLTTGERAACPVADYHIFLGDIGSVEEAELHTAGGETFVKDFNGTRYRFHFDRDQLVNWRVTLRFHGFVPLAGHSYAVSTDDMPLSLYLLNDAPPHNLDRFMEVADRCESSGFCVLLADELGIAEIADATQYATVATASDIDHLDWFDFEVGITVDGERHSLGDVLAAALEDPSFSIEPKPHEPPTAKTTLRLENGRRVRVPLSQIRQSLRLLRDLLDGDAEMHAGRARVGKIRAAMAAEDHGIDVPENLAVVRDGLRKLSTISQSPLSPQNPALCDVVLRPYQLGGVQWLNALAEAELGGVLADDMGLGKTLQIIAHMLDLKTAGKLVNGAIVVVPKSLLNNWRNELGGRAPSLSVLIIDGPQRFKDFARIGTTDVVITSYPLLFRDVEHYRNRRFDLGVLDEAQEVKNVKSKTGEQIRSLLVRRWIPATGTPLENSVVDAWSQINLAVPGLLGSARTFKKHFQTPIEKHKDGERQARLSRLMKPFVLRRTKALVASDLPPKIEKLISLEMTGDQAAAYESVRATMDSRVRALIAEHGIKSIGIHVLAALLRLRQACCDPLLLGESAIRPTRTSVKLGALMELLRGLAAEGRQALVFSSFVEMLDLIAQAMDKEGLAYGLFTGDVSSTRKRGQLVEGFQSGAIPFMLLSLKAGGVGLNLTAADTVIHYDPWWNPQVEKQATDRAHRIGQDKTVFEYRLICAGTVEEKILALQATKKALADAVLGGGSLQEVAELTEAVVLDLLAPPGS